MAPDLIISSLLQTSINTAVIVNHVRPENLKLSSVFKGFEINCMICMVGLLDLFTFFFIINLKVRL